MPQTSIPAIVAARRNACDGSAPWSSPLAPLPPDIEGILKCAAGDSAAVAAAAEAANTRPMVAESACRWFIRHVLFRPGASYYWNLGVERDANLELIRAHYRRLISIFHPDRLQQSDERDWYESFAKRVNEAYNTLKNSETRMRYDRLQNAGEPSDAAMGATGQRSASSAAEAPKPRQPRSLFARASWRNAPSRGSVVGWLDQQRPATLRLLSVVGVVLVVLCGVLLHRAQTSGHAEIALPVETQTSPPLEPDVRLADLVTQQPPAVQAPVDVLPAVVHPVVMPTAPPAKATLGTATVRPPVTAVARPPVEVHSAPPVHVAPGEASPRTVPGATVAPPNVPREVPRAPVPAKADGAAPVPSAIDEIPAVAVAAPAVEGVAIAAPVPPERALPVSDADINQVLSRFAKAYDAGDFPALMILIDPEAARGDAMAFTLANFNRLFRDTASRHIDLREIKRSADNDRTRVQLQTRVIVVGRTSGQRIDVGQLSLIFRKRGDATVIAGMVYHAGTDG